MTIPALLALGVLVVTAVCLAAFAASVIVPRLAAADAARALLLASSSRPGSLDSALVQARRSSRLDPLSDAGLLAAATIQIHRGDFTAARQDLISALGREPSDGQAWQELSYMDLALHRDAEWMVATQRALAADPESPAASAALSLAAPAGSATATATPGSVR